MTKLAQVTASRQVSRKAPSGPAAKSAAAREIDPAWIDFADHVLMEKFPLVLIATELLKNAKARRLSLRAVLMIAALAIYAMMASRNLVNAAAEDASARLKAKY